MTISQTSEYVLEHPFTKKAIKEACQGNFKNIKFILDLLQIDTYQEVAGLCAKAFKSKRGQNNPIIEEAIREVEPPTKLNIRLPIPPPECIVVVMKGKIGRYRLRIINPYQLEIDFAQKKPLFQAAF
jgi:hypothetical protein